MNKPNLSKALADGFRDAINDCYEYDDRWYKYDDRWWLIDDYLEAYEKGWEHANRLINGVK